MLTQKILIGIAGIIGLLSGGHMIVHGAKKIAKNFGISEFFIGLTVLSIGTSLPEISTHIVSSIEILLNPEKFQVLSGIAVGTNVGSNIIQITLITGISGLVATMLTNKTFLKRDYTIMLCAIFGLWVFSLNHYISRVEGVILVGLYIYYMYYLTKNEKLRSKIKNNHTKKISENIKCTVFLVIGLILLIYCAEIILKSAVFATEYFHLSGSLIGTLIIGIITALPEFTTSVIGLIKKSSGISLGTLVGSNITNPMLALGIGAIISEYHVDNTLLWYDIPFWFIVSTIILLFLWTNLRLEKHFAFITAGFYIIYVVLRLHFF